MMNYDLAAGGGIVEYTEKFSKHYKNEIISQINDMFQVQLNQVRGRGYTKRIDNWVGYGQLSFY